MIDTSLQRTLEMRETLCGTAEFHVLADVISALFAAMARIAGDADFKGYAVAGLEV
jgi:hypothetical protein